MRHKHPWLLIFPVKDIFHLQHRLEYGHVQWNWNIFGIAAFYSTQAISAFLLWVDVPGYLECYFTFHCL